jgi:bifunctional enzyme Fae/Hps
VLLEKNPKPEKNFKKCVRTLHILETIFTLVGIGATGGVRVNVVKDALKAGTNILVVGCMITASKDIKHAAEGFIKRMDKEEINQFGVVTNF